MTYLAKWTAKEREERIIDTIEITGETQKDN